MELGGFVCRGLVLSLMLVVLVGPCSVFSQCQKISSCSCRLPNAGIIDLTPIGSGNPLYKDLKATQFPDDFLYSWNPCKDFTETDACKGVAACQKSTDGQTSYSLGDQGSATFGGDNNSVTVSYTGPSPDNRQSQVTLTCSSGATQFTVLGEDQTVSLYKFELKSPCACPGAGSGCAGGAISGGSILLIVCTVLLVVYIVGGILFMSFVKKASGTDRIPNKEFWKDLPTLVKDGAVFAVSPLRGKGKQYDNI